MLVYDYKLLQIGRLQQFIRINNVGVKWGGVSRQRTRQLPQDLGKHQHQTNWCQIRILSTTRLSGPMIWWWNFPKIHLAPNHKHQEITSGAQVEKYHFPTQMLECQDDCGFEGPAGVRLCKFGASFYHNCPHITTGENGHVTECHIEECLGSDTPGFAIEHSVKCRHISKTSLLSHSCHLGN